MPNKPKVPRALRGTPSETIRGRLNPKPDPKPKPKAIRGTPSEAIRGRLLRGPTVYGPSPSTRSFTMKAGTTVSSHTHQTGRVKEAMAARRAARHKAARAAKSEPKPKAPRSSSRVARVAGEVGKKVGKAVGARAISPVTPIVKHVKSRAAYKTKLAEAGRAGRALARTGRLAKLAGVSANVALRGAGHIGTAYTLYETGKEAHGAKKAREHLDLQAKAARKHGVTVHRPKMTVGRAAKMFFIPGYGDKMSTLKVTAPKTPPKYKGPKLQVPKKK